MHGRVDFDAANQTDRCQVVNGQSRQPVASSQQPGSEKPEEGEGY
jgi:hypothetical protein